MKTNFCFDLVIAVEDHDASVRKCETLLEIEAIELAPETLPESGQRCTIFPVWNLEDRGMALSIVSTSDPESALSQRIRERRIGNSEPLFGSDKRHYVK